MREISNPGVGDKELGQIADKYLWKGELSSHDFLDRMNERERWFINMIKKMRKRIDAAKETSREIR